MKHDSDWYESFMQQVRLAQTPLYDPRQRHLRSNPMLDLIRTSDDPHGAFAAEMVHIEDDYLWATTVLLRYEKLQNITPKNAERLVLLFGSKEERNALVGDLEEELKNKIFPRHGYSFGVLWYWTQVLLFLAHKSLQGMGAIFSLFKFWIK